MKGGEVSGSSKNHSLHLSVSSQWQSQVSAVDLTMIMTLICRDDSPFKLERASPPPSSDLSHPLLSSNLPTSSSHSAYNPIWSPASISPNANELMSGPGSGAANGKMTQIFNLTAGYLPSEKSGGYPGSGVYGANYG